MVIYGASPHLLGQAYNGISETVCAGWLPIALWCLLHFLDRPTWRRALILGASMAMTMLTSWYYGLFAIIATAVIVTWKAARQPWVQPWVRSLIRLAGAALTGLVLVFPALLHTFWRTVLDHRTVYEHRTVLAPPPLVVLLGFSQLG